MRVSVTIRANDGSFSTFDFPYIFDDAKRALKFVLRYNPSLEYTLSDIENEEFYFLDRKKNCWSKRQFTCECCGENEANPDPVYLCEHCKEVAESVCSHSQQP